MKLTNKEIESALKDIKTILALTSDKIEGLKAELNEATCEDDIKIIHSMITNHVNQCMELQQREKELLEMEQNNSNTSTITAALINYFDVWGNAEEGYEINNLCKEGELELREDFREADLLQELQDFGFIVEEATMKDITFEWAGSEMIEIYETKTNYPLGRVELPY